MAVYPDRIVVKNSTDSLEDIVTSITPGGSEEILQGEIVLSLAPGSARLLTRDGDDNIVQFGGNDATRLGALEDVDLTGLADDDFLQYNEATDTWTPVTLNFDKVSGVTFGTVATSIGSLDYFSVDNRALLSGDAVIGGANGAAYFVEKAGGDSLSFTNNNGAIISTRYGLNISPLRSDTPANIRLLANTGDGSVSLRSPADLSANYDYTLPDSYGTTGFVLTTDGLGGLTWSGPARTQWRRTRSVR